ncbi:heavy metal-associated isoprenylated plant protein 16-like isoform X1 [Typha latifolia]|uniref:heavy metal-associated isoprenylated plant protein 16-like isoform X1 n=1 Tax=Typha latifolia TaxID=4733 RepID=UPI003C3037F1
MAKQKIVLKLYMEDKKKRRKALRTAVGLSGNRCVESASLEEDKIVVVGEGIDSIALTTMLRKRMSYADLVSVTSVDEKDDQKKKQEETILSYQFGAIKPLPVVIHEPGYDHNSCIIM